MKQIVLCFLVGLTIFGTFFCALDKPTSVDGTLTINLVVVDTSGTIVPKAVVPVPKAQLYILSNDYNLFFQDETDDQGYIVLHHLLASRYQVNAYKYFSGNLLRNSSGLLLTGTLLKDFSRQRSDPEIDTLRMGLMHPVGLVINEIYYSGAPNSNNYFSDQYIELYNASSTTQYLDGLFLCRISGDKNQGNRLVAIEFYQFPGMGNDFPVAPQQFVVIAQDAIDHVTERKVKTSIDLSHADWEFYNKFSSDIDNPRVPNLENRAPSKIGDDFIINLSNDEVALIRADDPAPVEYYQQKGKPTPYRIFRVDRVIDGVEYSVDPNMDQIKAFDVRIDAGYAGLGIERYSGHSIERHDPITDGPGFDTNNSSFDFKSLNRPTPGWQHSAADIYTPHTIFTNKRMIAKVIKSR